MLVVHVLPPVRRHPPLGAGHALVDRVLLRRRELRAVVGLLGLVAVEPVLTRLEALDERVSRSRSVRGRVLHGRGVAAADMPALRAPAQVHPPAARGLALDAAFPARRHRRVDPGDLAHVSSPPHTARRPAAEPGTACSWARCPARGPFPRPPAWW